MMYDNDNDPRFIADREMLGLPEMTTEEARQIIAQEFSPGFIRESESV